MLPRHWFLSLACLLLAFLAAPHFAHAQQTNCISCGSITVAPAPDSVVQNPSLSGQIAVFTITNTTSAAVFLTGPTCSRTGSITSCGSISIDSPDPLGANSSTNAYVTYATGTAGPATLTLQVLYSGHNASGILNALVAQHGPVVIADSVRNRPDQLERSLCLTAGAGEAAWQCGDLVVAHAMPSYRSLGRDRTLTLLYNSATAAPRPAVAIAIKEPVGTVKPDAVYVELWVSDATGGNLTLKASGTYGAWGTAWAETSRQVILSYDASAMATGIYNYTIQVKNIYGTGVQPSFTTHPGRLVIVNRSTSVFGRGWALEGVERIYPNGASNPILWVGGDGSARIYSLVTTNKWAAPLAAYQDTIALSGSTYTRTLRYGVKVTYSSAGQHLTTTNRAGQTSRFSWSSLEQLDSIHVPPKVLKPYYRISYAGGLATKLIDPSGRALGLTVSGSPAQLMTIMDPDTVPVSFTYDAAGRMNGRTNRLGYNTIFSYGVSSGKAALVRVPYGPTGADIAQTTYRPWEEFALAAGIGGTGLVAVDTTAIKSTVVGPRGTPPDSTVFFIDRWGAPSRIVNALAATTTIERKSMRCPALVTMVAAPNGHVTRMFYDTTATSCKRGNVLTVLDTIPGGTGESPVQPARTTRYEYASPNTADSPTKITDAGGHLQTFTYDSLGLTSSATDARGHVTTFVLYTDSVHKGLPYQVTEKSVQTWIQNTASELTKDQTTTFVYDTLQQVNVIRVTNPLGIATAYQNDAIGRVAAVYDAFRVKTDYHYDALNRTFFVARNKTQVAAGSVPGGDPLAGCLANEVTCAATVALAPGSFPTALVDSTTLGAAGVTAMIDPRQVKRQYRYDARGMVWSQIDELLRPDSTVFDAGGLAIMKRTRRGENIQYAYDILGRQVSITYPSTTWPLIGTEINDPNWHTGVVPGDVVHFAFDTVGVVDSSWNRSGTIVHRYYRNGALQQVDWMPKGSTGTPQWHDVLQYVYDSSGARIKVTHNGDVTQYTYNATTGDLAQMQVTLLGDTTRTFQFAWDTLGRRRTVTYPAATTFSGSPMAVSFRYDAGGTMRQLISANLATPPSGINVLRFTLANEKVDPLGRVLSQTLLCQGGISPDNACGGKGTYTDSSLYNVFGWLQRQRGRVSLDTMDYDPSGNIVYRFRSDAVKRHYTMLTGSNRVATELDTTGASTVQTVTFEYDSTGERYREAVSSGGNSNGLNRYWYDALGRTSGTYDYTLNTTTQRQPDACHYDALGQMVSTCGVGGFYYALDGANVVGTAMPNVQSVCTAGPCWRFSQGPGLDDPLMGVFKLGPNPVQVLYWVTDGHGRQYAVGSNNGVYDPAQTYAFPQNGIGAAGGTSNAQSFDASRGADSTPHVAFFRNRVYDLNSGRWTQEDPLGVGGGMNLYQYGRNNPVSYSDPFGLKPCKPLLAVGAVLCLVQNVADLVRNYRQAGDGVIQTQAPDIAPNSVSDGIGRALKAIGSKTQTGIQNTGTPSPPGPTTTEPVTPGPGKPGGGITIDIAAGTAAVGVGLGVLMIAAEGLVPQAQPEHVCQIESCDPSLPVSTDPVPTVSSDP